MNFEIYLNQVTNKYHVCGIAHDGFPEKQMADVDFVKGDLYLGEFAVADSHSSESDSVVEFDLVNSIGESLSENAQFCKTCANHIKKELLNRIE